MKMAGSLVTVHTHTHTHTNNLKEEKRSYIIEENNRHY